MLTASRTSPERSTATSAEHSPDGSIKHELKPSKITSRDTGTPIISNNWVLRDRHAESRTTRCHDKHAGIIRSQPEKLEDQLASPERPWKWTVNLRAKSHPNTNCFTLSTVRGRNESDLSGQLHFYPLLNLRNCPTLSTWFYNACGPFCRKNKLLKPIYLQPRTAGGFARPKTHQRKRYR